MGMPETVDPFPYQRPVLPGQIINRDQETARMVAEAHAGKLVRLDAPRRFGKTSLARRVQAELDRDGTVGILIDLKGVLTLSDVTFRIGAGYARLRGPLARVARPILTSLEARIGGSFGGANAGLRLAAPQPSEEAALASLLALPQRFVDRGWQRVNVCFDEFQDLLVVPGADDKLRSVIQHQPDAISYVFAGSQPRLMNELFANRRRAFWSQAERVELRPLDIADCAEYIGGRFEDTGRDPGEALSPLLQTAQGHPQRTMMLASKLWTATPPGGEATIETWQAALADAQLQAEPEFDAVWAAQTKNQQRLLRAVALNAGRPFQKPAPEAVGLASGSIDATVRRLVSETLLWQFEPGVFGFVDPLFGLYVRDLAGHEPATGRDRD